ncbi:hypothetical protein BGZ63DRAFT_432708 [Mariannaea sp. PMI_226]|nr:hypothetical protein BGZ63DRAFT_432708 [Mariannaea sp. PMI_226]
MASFPKIDGVEVFRLPPPGYVVDFAHPQQQKKLDHYLIFGIGGPLALIALLQRYYTKIFLSKGLQVDDASIAEGGMCAHSWEMPLERYERYSFYAYLSAPIYMLCNGFVKLSLLTFYLHLSPQKWFRTSVWISIGIVAVYTILITFMMFFVCNPPRKAFDFKVEGGTCIEAGILYIATAVSNIVTDSILFVLPIPMVYQLHMPRIQKVGAIVIFGIGSLTIATSIIRLAYLPPVLASTDPSWDAAPADIWTFIEGNLFVICGSLPTLRRFFKHLMPRLMGSSKPTDYGNTYGHHQQSGTVSRARKQRTQFSQYPEDDDETELRRISADDKLAGTVAVRISGTPDGQQDDHSERHILRRQSFTVQYDARSEV